MGGFCRRPRNSSGGGGSPFHHPGVLAAAVGRSRLLPRVAFSRRVPTRSYRSMHKEMQTS